MFSFWLLYVWNVGSCDWGGKHFLSQFIADTPKNIELFKLSHSILMFCSFFCYLNCFMIQNPFSHLLLCVAQCVNKTLVSFSALIFTGSQPPTHIYCSSSSNKHMPVVVSISCHSVKAGIILPCSPVFCGHFHGIFFGDLCEMGHYCAQL